MPPVKLYYYPTSGPSRGALISARAIGVPIQIEILDVYKKDQFKEDFLKINPQHCVPTMVDDDGFILWESKAIAGYLSDKYGKDDRWYPKDLKQRSVVNSRLYFDASNLYVKYRAIFYAKLANNEVDQSKKDDLNAALGILDTYLSESNWLAGETPTIADTCIYASVTNILNLGWDMSPFPNVQRWLKECRETLPGAPEITDEGTKAYREAFNSSQFFTNVK